MTPVHARLNVFQRMMLRWRSLHPYNPVHVVRVPAVLDLARLRSIVSGQLESRGLTGLWVDARGRCFRFDGGPAQLPLDLVGAAEVSPQQLAAVIERELNRPFAELGRLDPFRFLVARTGASFQLALVYDHFVASGDSVAAVLTDIALSYLGGDVPPVKRPRHRAHPTYRTLLLRHPLWALRAVAGLPGMARRVRRASRSPGMDVADADNGLVMLRVEPRPLRALIACCRSWGVTVNDLLLAALLLTLAPLAPLAASRRSHAHRTDLAVASIVNIRRDFGTDATHMPSPCLAAFHVGHAVPDGIGLRELARDVHAQSAPIRHKRLYLRSILGLELSGLIWPILGASRRRDLYAKHFPAWGGVTALNLNPTWAARAEPLTRQLDYFRVVPTGPLCPLVLAATTAHDVMHIGIAYRSSVFSRQTVTQLAEALLRHIDLPQPAP
jgi:hypothetical protein